MRAPSGLPIGVQVGAGIGALIGSVIRTDKWVAVPLEDLRVNMTEETVAVSVPIGP